MKLTQIICFFIGFLIWTTPVTIHAQETATLSILPTSKIDDGVQVMIKLRFGSKGGKLPAWVVDSRDDITGAFVISQGKIVHGRIAGSQDGQQKKDLTREVVIPPDTMVTFAYTLGNHEIYQYRMDKDIVDVSLSISHKYWSSMKATFKITKNGHLIPLSKGYLDSTPKSKEAINDKPHKK